MKIGFIGVGNMGFAMLKGALKVFKSEDILYTDVDENRLEYVQKQMSVPYNTCEEVIEKATMIVLAIKPQYYTEFFESIQPVSKVEEKIFISIAPGITIESIKNHLGSSTKVVRAMPNTPAMVGEGMSALCFSDDSFDSNEKQQILSFFSSFGESVELTENQMNMVVPVSGSSPAYVYMFIEAMADAGVLFGLPRKVAYQLAAQSVLGSAKMVLESGEHPGVLKDAVCSPGGTTIEAVKKLESLGFRGMVIQAMEDCYKKSVQFSKK